MNPENPQSPRDELQARLTALLLGELSDEEAASLRRAIEQDADLARLYERLKHTIDLVRETAASPVEQTAAQPVPLRLGDERRQKLLAHFKTVAPNEFVQPRPRESSWLVPLGAAAAILLLAAISIPNFTRARESSQANSVMNNLRILEGAKEQWALENKKSSTDIVALSDLKPYLKGNEIPQPVLGENYIVGTVSDPITADLDAAQARKSFGELATKQPARGTRGQRARLSADAGLTFVDKDPASGAPWSRSASVDPVADGAIPESQGRFLYASSGLEKERTEGLERLANRPAVAAASTPRASKGGQSIYLPTDGMPAESANQALGDGLAGGGAGFGGRGDALARREPSPIPGGRWAKPSEEAKTPVGAILPQVSVEARLGDSRERNPEALGLERLKRNLPESEAGIGVQAGTAPSFAGATPAATPVPMPGAKADNVPALGDVPALGTQLRTDTATADTPGYYNRLMMERYGLIPKGPPPSAGGETTTVPTEYGLAPSAVLRTAGKDLSTWAAGQSGVVVTNGLASAPERPPVERMPQNVELADGLDRNWRLDSNGVRGREASEGGVYSAKPVGYVNVPPNSADAAEKSVRRKSSAIVLPPGTNTSPTADVNQALSRYAELEDRTLLRSQNLPPANVSLQENLQMSREEAVRSLDLALASNGIVMVPVGDKFIKAVPSIEALAEGRALNEKGGLDEAKAKRELENLQTVRDAVALRIEQEKVDAALPKAGIVEILDSAEAQPAKSPTLWQRIGGALTGDVERTARISVEKDTSNIMPLMGLPDSSQYDPYFIQTEFEKIRSKKVLYRVIEKLNLNEAWANKHGSGGKLKTEETAQLLSKKLDIRTDPKTTLIEIKVKSDKPDEAARIANTIAEVYRDSRMELRKQMTVAGTKALEEKLVEQDKEIARAREELKRVEKESNSQQADEDRPVVPRKPAPNAPIPQPEIQTHDNAWSTFSLNVSDVSFKLAAASLEKGVMPEPATVRSEEFINAFDYRDPEPPSGVPIAFAWERARYPFAHNRDLLRFSVKTAAAGRQPGRPLNLVLLLDNSGSMERADRVRIIHEALRVLAAQLQPQDKLSVITFARTARLWMDGVPGNQAAEVAEQVGGVTPQGGTNLEEAMKLAYQTALRHYLAGGVNRVVLLTDGAANLGNVDPESLKQKVEAHRKQGIALDCFGVGWEGFNDDLLEVLSRNGDGRYGFINSPEEAATEFAGQLAGALRVAASDVKVQVEFNPNRVTAYRQIGYAKHQLTKEQFRDNTVDAAEIGAAESGNALYVVEVNPRGEGPLAIVRVRFKVPGTSDYREHEWAVPFTGNAVSLEQAGPAMRLAATASAFSEWLVSSPYAAEVTPDRLLGYLSGVPEIYGADARPKKLEWMIRQAKSLEGK